MNTNPSSAAAPAPAAPASVPSALAPAPTAPVNPMDLSDADLSARYVADATRAEDAAAGEPQVVIARDSEAPTEATAAEAEPQADGAPDSPAAPDPAPVEAPPLATSFAVFDQQGELEIPRDLEISFKAGGKDLKLPLDRVVRMAQSAPQAEQFRQDAEQLPQVREYATKLEQSYQSLQQEIQQNNALYERLLRDPDLYVQAVQAYEAQNSPERRAERAEREAAALKAKYEQDAAASAMQRQSAEAYQYATTRIVPAVEQIAAQFPTIDRDELTDRYYRLTAPLVEARPDGQGTWVPPQKLPEVERLVTSDLADWARTLHAKRAAVQQATTVQATAQVTQAQTAAQLAKRQLARATAPAGTPATPDAPRPKPIKSSADAVERALEKVRAQVAGS